MTPEQTVGILHQTVENLMSNETIKLTLIHAKIIAKSNTQKRHKLIESLREGIDHTLTAILAILRKAAMDGGVRIMADNDGVMYYNERKNTWFLYDDEVSYEDYHEFIAILGYKDVLKYEIEVMPDGTVVKMKYEITKFIDTKSHEEHIKYEIRLNDHDSVYKRVRYV